jgi:hypothetical protein
MTMTDLEQAAALLEVDAKFFQLFDVNDPFNDDARLEGYLCQKPNHTYGVLALLRVDGRPAPQCIFATPKLHYPFGKDGSFHFPAIHTAHLYETLKAQSLSINKDIAAAMRVLSGQFRRDQMGHVYAAIVQLGE